MGTRGEGRDVRSAGIGIPAAFVQVEPELDDSVVVQKLPTHDPVSGHEAGEMRTDVADSAAVIEVREVRPVADRRFLRPPRVVSTKDIGWQG